MPSRTSSITRGVRLQGITKQPPLLVHDKGIATVFGQEGVPSGQRTQHPTPRRFPHDQLAQSAVVKIERYETARVRPALLELGQAALRYPEHEAIAPPLVADDALRCHVEDLPPRRYFKGGNAILPNQIGRASCREGVAHARRE